MISYSISMNIGLVLVTLW